MSKHEHAHHDKATCPECRSTNVYGMSRVVGYYSIIENWNDSKKAELVDRQKGSYKLSETLDIESPCLEPQITEISPEIKVMAQ